MEVNTSFSRSFYWTGFDLLNPFQPSLVEVNQAISSLVVFSASVNDNTLKLLKIAVFRNPFKANVKFGWCQCLIYNLLNSWLWHRNLSHTEPSLLNGIMNPL